MSLKFVPRQADMFLPVPNVVHFIWSNTMNSTSAFTFLQYMSMLSVSNNIKPCYILWHGTFEPFGCWWNRTVSEIPNKYYLQWALPETIEG